MRELSSTAEQQLQERCIRYALSRCTRTDDIIMRSVMLLIMKYEYYLANVCDLTRTGKICIPTTVNRNNNNLYTRLLGGRNERE